MGCVSREGNSSVKSLKKLDPVSTGNIDPYSGGEWGETGNQGEERWREELPRTTQSWKTTVCICI